MATASQDVPIYPSPQPNRHIPSEENETDQSLTPGMLDGHTEGHQRIIASSTVTVVTCLALEFNVDEVSE
jgi:hypothetical protein